MSKIRVRMAFAIDNGDEQPWLVSAVDEFTEDAWNGLPAFYVDATTEARRSGDVRELVVSFDYDAVLNLFGVPEIDGEVTS